MLDVGQAVKQDERKDGMRRHVYLCAILIVLLGALMVRAEDAERSATPTFASERFYQDVRQLVRQHYPDATSHRLGNKVHFEHDTRIFVVHDALKTGEWQDPREERGPRKNGVYCDIWFRKGAYGGAATVPQTFDKRYFTVLLLAPYSSKLDGHLYVHLKLPGNGRAPEGFEEQATALINGFEKYADG